MKEKNWSESKSWIRRYENRCLLRKLIYSDALMPTKKPPPTSNLPVPVSLIERRIYLIRSQKVMIDTDLAQLYGVPTYRLNEGVKRNRKRFPSDFMFQL